MYNDKKTIKINLELQYDYESELNAIKEILKQITDLKSVKSIEYKEEK